jgi:ribose 5-phosphate isomerase B
VRIAIGADHRGFEMKERIKRHLEARDFTVLDFGTASLESTDYPQYAFRVGEAVRDGSAERGILVCDSGNGIAIAANKVEGVRAALCVNPKHAEMSRRHNDANVLVLGSAILPLSEEASTVDVWLATEFEGGRHARRVDQISEYEHAHQRR